MTAYNIIKSLTKQGNAVIGAGCYAAALSSRVDGNKVIKIGNNINDPWLDYYQIIKENQHNPCVPRIHSFYIDVDNEYYVCVMEKLESREFGKLSQELADLCKEYVQGWYTRFEFMEFTKNYTTSIPYPEHLANLLETIREQTDIIDCDLTDDTEDLGGLKKLDMHQGNFLYRDNAIVVTDPWCEADMADINDVSDWWASRQ